MLFVVASTTDNQEIFQSVGPAPALRDDMVNCGREEPPLALAGRPAPREERVSGLERGDALRALHIHSDPATWAIDDTLGEKGSDELDPASRS
ncbi:hypothetical protein [uncultured Planktomarina sp.]|uniref:hypothetical protein n=1 Tax=uncultured Planktomarina sp. TaxID=1538529 RepID=UPI00325FF2EC